MKIVIISLKRSLDRRNRIASQLQHQGVDYEFFDAIDGSLGEHALWQNYNHIKRKWLISGKIPSKGELGCYASHLSVWKKCVAINQPLMVIEDDASIKDCFVSQLGHLRHAIAKYHLLRLEKEVKGALFNVENNSNCHIFYMSNNFGGARAYALTPLAAKKLLDSSSRWCMPVDNYIGSTYLHGVPSFLFKPYLVENPSDFETTIQLNQEKPAPFYVKLTREFYSGYRKFRLWWFNRKQLSQLN